MFSISLLLEMSGLKDGENDVSSVSNPTQFLREFCSTLSWSLSGSDNFQISINNYRLNMELHICATIESN